ncbi:DNA modification methylase [Agrococcus casei]|uniref:Adenine-specific methyltransferase n=1 Tax=Agrococcus casei LMG 22410 TaxID=1255656 RepID=A0A1R4FGU4_9MICO|nr:DNA modification methylase [Agrococcus casei]SJM55077.1 Adenine-specific methyltransferase [Agrococcus casei LMG 22410]
MALEVTVRPLSELKPYHQNPRRGNTAAIADSLAKRGQYKPIVVNLGTHTGRPMEILAGNHTFLAAHSLDWPTIQVVTVDVNDAEAAQIVLADNKLADLGGYDDVDLLATLQEAGSLDATGYTDQDLTELLRALDEPVGLTDPDDVPALTDTTITAEGDVWRLGPHVLYVGSSGNVEAVADAAQGTVDAVWTDPPYGVSYVGGTGMTIKNDGADEAVQTFADAVGTILAVARPGAPVYVAHADLMRGEFQRVMSEAGILYRQTLIWVKNALVMGRADYHWKHEPILEAELPEAGIVDESFDPVAYGFTPGGEGRLGRGGKRWYGDNKSSTVFQVPKPKANSEHPTMKPVELIERMLRNSVQTGGLVFDPFGGSGSTLIAAHRLGARALLCELDPQYADVICRRWEEHTGVTPIRDGEPVTFTDAP